MILVQLCYSKDGGHTWSNWKEREISSVGEYAKRIRFLGMGQGRQFVFKWRVSAPVKRDTLGANVRITPGGS